MCVCVPGNIVRAADKSAPAVARDGLDRDRFISSTVMWLLGWRGHCVWRHSGSLPKLLPRIMQMKDFVQMPREMTTLKKIKRIPFPLNLFLFRSESACHGAATSAASSLERAFLDLRHHGIARLPHGGDVKENYRRAAGATAGAGAGTRTLIAQGNRMAGLTKAQRDQHQ